MTEIKQQKNIQEIYFDTDKLGELSFGRLEGERDPLLKDCFFPTYSIQKYLQRPYNYVLSPKGAGKSALYRALTDDFIPEIFFSREPYSIIPINDAFGFDDEYLDVAKFSEDSRIRLTISWALFLLTKLIEDIRENFKDGIGYGELMDNISKIGELKEKFNLYDLGDFLKSINTSIKFTANGQEFEVAPTIKIETKKQKLVLNKLFREINKFYKTNKKTALILIDRIDNFVQKEEYSLQKKYIQGLFDCIEEISLFDSIIPTMFLRTDLFYSYDSEMEYDKVKDRLIELKWEKGETLNFLVFRLNHNSYITKIFDTFLKGFIDEAKQGKHRKFKQEKQNIFVRFISYFWKKKKARIFLDTSKPLNYTISDKYLKLFYPDEINIDCPLKFDDWIFSYLKDANDFINPRLLIYFFNQLAQCQFGINKSCYPDRDSKLKQVKINGSISFDIFCHEAIDLTYKKVKQDELKNIYTLLKSREYQTLFKYINERNHESGIFRYGDVKLKNFGVDKETYESFLKYLKLLGYCKESERQKFEIPLIYRSELDVL
ncbi:hypothetical protein KDU71_22430 [Carboxylicivirga sediminis]|uniref:Uncharacterized protein n=1 Tax=Carboxylicivirga sediminis TaxID=2006564 RepID=A0A941FDF3_9BACT|nr:hypothetical protein [Carboxylicivirga sediminis]MBR8538345.1 hypothetical protein [Carboxylicivirga sediminis]